MSLAPKKNRRQQAKYILSSFYTFCVCTKLLPDLAEKPHLEMCDELQDYFPVGPDADHTMKEIFLAPRGSFKTSVLKAFMVYCYLRNPNIRMVYGRAGHEDAKKVLRSVREAFETNPVILDTWGNVKDTASSWSEDSITCARSNYTLTEPTIDTTALGMSLTGTHPDLVMLDDLVNDVNYMSELTTERSRELLLSAEPVIEKGGSIIVSGTRWQPNDVYGWLMAQDDQLEEEGKERQWHRYIRSVYLDAEHTELYFPDRINEDFLKQKRESLRNSMRLFSSWYYNLPYEEGTKLFPMADLNFYEAKFWRFPAPYLEFANGDQVPVYVSMTIDPAPTVGKYSDFTGVTVVGCDNQGIWWLLWAEALKLTPSALAAAIYSLVLKFAPDVIGIETGQADPEFVSRLQTKINDEEMLIENRPSVLSYSPKSDERRGERGKNQRIEALEPYFREGYIYLPKGGHIRELLLQLDGYPSLDHDDVLDALAMQRTFVRAAREQSVTEVDDRIEREEEKWSWGPQGKAPERSRRTIQGGDVGFGRQYLRG